MAKCLKALFLLLPLTAGSSHAGIADGATCVAPAKPGGGFDLTCQLLRDALQSTGETRKPLNIVYQPGGVGALVFDATASQHSKDAHRLVAFSSGTLLNLAQRRFGAYTLHDVKWLEVFGVDYGVIVVQKDSPHKNLKSLVEALKKDPNSMAFGSSGTIGSQDWIKAALVSKVAGVNYKNMKVVAFEGGGDVLNALEGGNIQVAACDSAEVYKRLVDNSNIRVLAIMADKRLPGKWSSIPTAKEQGFDLTWRAYRGVYMGAGVDDTSSRQWVDAIDRSIKNPSFLKVLASSGFNYSHVTGQDLNRLIENEVSGYAELVKEFNLMRK